MTKTVSSDLYNLRRLVKKDFVTSNSKDFVSGLVSSMGENITELIRTRILSDEQVYDISVKHYESVKILLLNINGFTNKTNVNISLNTKLASYIIYSLENELYETLSNFQRFEKNLINFTND